MASGVIIPLKYEMKLYVISGVSNKLMESNLRSRYQRVVINTHNNSDGHFSKWEKVKHGVPWGSVLGTLFFLIYVHDLSKIVSDKSIPILFADDTSFIIANFNETKFKFNTNEIFTEINGSIVIYYTTINLFFLKQFLTKTDHEVNMKVLFWKRKIATAQSLKL